jgi:branched-chain amino acid transport system permease protein
MAFLPCGVHFEKYRQDRAYLHTKPQWAWFIAFLVLLLLLPQLISIRFVAMISMTAMIMIAVVGLQITSGYAGLVNLGQSAFMGMGAFVAASLAHNGGALLGALFGIPALRIKGFYLALTTIAAQVMFPVIVMHMPKSWFGGALVLSVEPAQLGGLTFNTDKSLYYLIMIVAIVMIYFAFNLVRTRVGRAFVALRDNDIAAEIMGVNLVAYKTLAFFVGAFYAGVAGGLWAYYIRYIGADQFTLYYSVWYMGMLIVGGLGSMLGAILGTIFIRALQELVTYLGPMLVTVFPQMGGQVWFAGMNILLGGTIILFLIFEPRGLAHRWNLMKTAFRIWPFPYF